jgi:hypothetical protein
MEPDPGSEPQGAASFYLPESIKILKNFIFTVQHTVWKGQHVGGVAGDAPFCLPDLKPHQDDADTQHWLLFIYNTILKRTSDL